MLPQLRSELFRMRRRWMTWTLLLIVVLGVAGVYVILWLVYATTGDSEPAQIRADRADDFQPMSVPDVGMDIANFLGSIVTVILSASIIGTEYGWGTIRALLPRARSRSALLGAKLAALVVFDVVIVLVGFVTAFAMAMVSSAIEGLDTGLGSDFWGNAVQSLASNLFVLLPYSALAFCVAVLTRSNAAGIAIGLAILLAEGIVVSILSALNDSLDWIGDLLFSNNMVAILDKNNLGGASADDLPGVAQAIAVLAIWIVLLVSMALWVFRRRDVTSG